jgi:hypothetical protein
VDETEALGYDCTSCRAVLGVARTSNSEGILLLRSSPVGWLTTLLASSCCSLSKSVSRGVSISNIAMKTGHHIPKVPSTVGLGAISQAAELGVTGSQRLDEDASELHGLPLSV